MLESDLGKVHLLAAASLSAFSLPADISTWQTYFGSTFTDLDLCYSSGIFRLNDRSGLDIEIDEDWIDKHTVRRLEI
jgi:L-alanine-DL-glutamate epimerase-like enolase superfamily enzyme